MKFVYLDEFGHNGPYVSRCHEKHNTSPVFGLAGIILPEQAVRPFATYFLQQKERAFSVDLANSAKKAYKWEKKGTSFIRPEPIRKYPEMRRLLMRMMDNVTNKGGAIFYYGREKEAGKLDGNSNGLYTTCLSHALGRLNDLCEETNDNYVVVVDQHSARKKLLECAAKIMFGVEPCRRLSSPPFEVEGYLNQNIQAADWVAILVGRVAAFQVQPDEFSDHSDISKYFADRLKYASVRSHLMKRPMKKAIVSSAEAKAKYDPNRALFDPSHPFAALRKLLQT